MEITRSNIQSKFARYVLPSVLTQLLSACYTVVDGFFIGRFTGDAGLAAVNLSWPVAAIIYATAAGISTGGAVLIGNRLGAGKPEEAVKARGTAITMLVLAGIFYAVTFTVLLPSLLTMLGAQGEVRVAAREYLQVIIWGSMISMLSSGLTPLLRNFGRTVGVMAIMMISGFLNVCLDGFFVGVLHTGAKGAAYATMIAQSFSLTCSLCFLFRIREHPVHFSEFRIRLPEAKSILSIGLSPFGLYMASPITLFITNWQCLRYGGNEALAAYAVAAYVTGAVGALLSGMGDGIQPLVSFAEGAKDHPAAKKVFNLAVRYSLAMAGTMTVITVISRHFLGRVFGCGPDALNYLNAAMIITPLGYPLMGLCKLASSYLYAGGDHRFASLLIYLDPLVMAPAMLLLMPVFFDVSGIWLSYPVAYLGMLLLTAALISLHEKNRIG